MKKSVILSLFVAFSLFSCRGDYDCVCTGNGVTDVVESYENIKKSDAKDLCEAQEALVKLFIPSGTCEIEKK